MVRGSVWALRHGLDLTLLCRAGWAHEGVEGEA